VPCVDARRRAAPCVDAFAAPNCDARRLQNGVIYGRTWFFCNVKFQRPFSQKNEIFSS